MKTRTLVPLLAVLCLYTSIACKKTDSLDWENISLAGSWKFSSVLVNAEEIVEIIQDGQHLKTISTSDYTSSSGIGSVIISDTAVSAAGIAYDISTTIKTDYYENDQYTGSEENPFYLSLPAMNLETPYGVVSTDSLHFPEGSFINFHDNQLKNQPVTVHYTISGRQLIVTQTSDLSSRTMAEGLELTQRNKSTVTCVLDRQ